MERMLKEGKKKIYSGEKEIRDSHSSFVVNTLIRDCFLKCLSFDQTVCLRNDFISCFDIDVKKEAK